MIKKLFTTAVVLVLLSSCFEPQEGDSQLELEVKLIDAHLAGTTEYIAYDPSGIRIVIQEFGELPPPHTGQVVHANITGTLFNGGTEFVSETIEKKLEEVTVPGLRFGLSALLVGTKATVYVPSAYGYGLTGSQDVPPNSILVYEIELTEVERTATEQTQFESDTASIRNYIRSNNITDVVHHPSGISYKITELVTGETPKPYDVISLQYKVFALLGTSPITEGVVTRAGIFGLIDGFKVFLPNIQQGSSAIVYIPSGLAYGPTGSTNIPQNANLKFEVKFTEVVKVQ